MAEHDDKDKRRDPARPEIDRELVAGAEGVAGHASPARPVTGALNESRESPRRVRVTSGGSERTIEVSELIRAVAATSSGVWKLQTRIKREERERGYEAPRWLVRQIESVQDALHELGVEVRDHTGERYVPGLAMSVIAFQPKAGIAVDVVAETLKPSVFFKDALIQPGEVIVATPGSGQVDSEDSS